MRVETPWRALKFPAWASRLAGNFGLPIRLRLHKYGDVTFSNNNSGMKFTCIQILVALVYDTT